MLQRGKVVVLLKGRGTSSEAESDLIYIFINGPMPVFVDILGAQLMHIPRKNF